MSANAGTSVINPLEKVVETTTLVIGAGPAGLAMGASLQRTSIPFIILEQNHSVGSRWHKHYDRLHLHSDKTHSYLPFFPFPKHYPRYPNRKQVIEYLEAYAQQFQLEPKFGETVIKAHYTNSLWEVRTHSTCYRAPNLVIATGWNREPFVPEWPGQTLFQGTILHSSQYRNGSPFKNQQVLVIGFGNSGGEIAIDLWEHGAQPSIAVRSPVNVIPRQLFGIPNLTLSILLSKLPPWLADTLNKPILSLIIGDLTRYGLQQLPYGPLTQIHKFGRIPLIDVGTIKLIKQGHVTVYPGVERFNQEDVVFVDGRQQKFDAVILATGYRPQVHSFLQKASAVHDAYGTPSSSGCETQIPGLYFCGFNISPTGMLREIALEAKQICADIARKHRSTAET